MVKSFKEKTQQFTGLSVLMFYYQEAQRQAVANGEYGKVKQINQIIERILIAEQKLRSNVSFQAVAEQFVLHTIFSLPQRMMIKEDGNGRSSRCPI
ncbi:hypothetical protein ACLZX5_09840 [Enterococcus faecium]